MIKNTEDYDFMKGVCEDTLQDVLDLLTDISSSMMSLNIQNEYLVNRCLQRIGEFTKASRVYVFMFRDELGYMDNTYEWCAEGVSSEINKLQNLATDNFQWWMIKLLKKEIIFIEEVEHMDPFATSEKQILLEQGIKSLITVPIFYHQELIGYIGIDFTKEKAQWSVSTPFVLKLTSEIFSSAFERLRHEKILYESQQSAIPYKGDGCPQLPAHFSYPVGTKAENLNRLIEEVLHDIESSLRVFDVVETNLTDQDPIILINKYDFFQVLIILIRNSIDEITRCKKTALRDFTHYLVLRTHQENNCVKIELLDSGQGFSPHDGTKVFNPFFTTKELGEGTGLGLTYAYDLIANKYHGSIEVVDSPEGGQVVILLPLLQSLLS